MKGNKAHIYVYLLVQIVCVELWTGISRILNIIENYRPLGKKAISIMRYDILFAGENAAQQKLAQNI